MSKLLIIDGNSLFNRAFYSTPLSFQNSEGVLTNAVYGFTNMLMKGITDFEPSHLAVVFDLKAPTFRHKLYDIYKATRKPMADELRVQVPIIKDVLRAMKVCILEQEGYEADDLAGTLAKHCDIEKVILTGDNDYLQLISKSTTICLTKKGLSDLDVKTPQTLFDSHALIPSQIIELKALMGDASDNIPGVAGVGEKTASTLIQKYKTLDGVYSNIDEIQGKLKEKLLLSKELAYLSKELATIDQDVPIEVNLDKMQLYLPFAPQVASLFQDLGFNSLLKRSNFFSENSQVQTPLSFSVTEIDSLDYLSKVVNQAMAESIVAIDMDDLSFSYNKSEVFKPKVGGNDLFSLGLDYSLVMGTMKPLFEGEIQKVIYDTKMARKILAKNDISLNNANFDLMLEKYLLSFEPTVNTLTALINRENMPDNAKPVAMLSLNEEYVIKLKKEGLYVLYEEIELPLSYILFRMETEGFSINKSELYDLKSKYTATLNALTEKIYSSAGETFNINSPLQLGNILFEKLNLSKGKKTRRGYSTDAETLEKLVGEHAIIALVLEYRKVAKLLSTYVDGLLSQVEADGKIHTEFNQALTTTGRLSSKEPNLQNIPIRTEMGRDLRRPFVPSSSDNLIVSADYSQIELRLLAHFSKDEILIDAYNHDKDIHQITASQVFHTPVDKVTDDLRRKAKAVNFGIIYGISDFGLGAQLSVGAKTAREYIRTYFEKYPKVHDYMMKNVEDCKANGYVSTIAGRRRYIKEIKSQNYVERSFGERAAMNMPLQGSSADIIKIAMINVFKKLNEQNLQSKLILQVHDELIIDCKKSELESVKKILKEQMEGSVKLEVKLPVNISVGESWYEAK